MNEEGESFGRRKKVPTIKITRAAIFASIYFVTTIFMHPLAYGPLQFRLGEAMSLLPILFPEAVIGLSIGCLIANIVSPFGWYDMLFGTLATVMASSLTYLIGVLLKKRKILIRACIGALPPIIINAFILPLMWFLFEHDLMYWLNFAYLLATQSGVIIALGIPLTLALSRIKSYEKNGHSL